MSDKDLVVVGMRFQDWSGLDIKAKRFVYLQTEPDNKANRNAIAVYDLDTKRKLGFIRDKDIGLMSESYRASVYIPNYTQIFYSLYQVNLSRQYYLTLEKQVDKLSESQIRDIALTALDKNKLARFGTDTNKIVGECGGPDIDYTTRALACAGNIHPDAYVTSINALNSMCTTVVSGTTSITDKQFQDQIKSLELKFANSNTTLLKNESKNTMNTANMKDSFFREVTNVVFDATTGKMGVKGKDGIYVFTKTGISVNPITEMGFKMPAFAIRTPVDNLKRGDIIVGEGDPVFFSKETEFGYEVVTLSGTIDQVGNVSNMFFGENTVLAVKSLFKDMLGGKGGMNPMAIIALTGGNMFGQTGGTGTQNEQMQQLAMMSMFSGGKGGLFGGKKKSKKAKKVKPDVSFPTTGRTSSVK